MGFRARTLIEPGRIRRSRPGIDVTRMPDNTPQYCAFDSDWGSIEKLHDRIAILNNNLLGPVERRTARYDSTGTEVPFVRLLFGQVFALEDTVVNTSLLPGPGGNLESYLYETYVVQSVTQTATVLRQREPREWDDGGFELKPVKTPKNFMLLVFKP